MFTDTTSMAYLAPLARFAGAVGVQLHGLADAYRTGGGVSWSEFGPDALTAQAEMNRPYYEQGLAPLLAGQPELHALLSRAGTRIADIGCGAGWSTIALSRAYPQATVTGFDLDDPSIELARINASETGTTGTRFVATDGTELSSFGPFDVIFAFECVHDMAHPVEVLNAARQALTPGGVLIVMDEATANTSNPTETSPNDFSTAGASRCACRTPQPSRLRRNRHPDAPGHAAAVRPASRIPQRGNTQHRRIRVLALLPPHQLSNAV